MPTLDPNMFRPVGEADHDALQFHKNGVLSPLPILSQDDVDATMTVLHGLSANRGGELSPMLRAKPHLLVPELWELVHHDTVLRQVTAILGSDLLCFGSSLIWKPAQRNLHVSWHQDATHWGLTRPDAVTVWLALTPSKMGSGCVLVAPGTHRSIVAHDHPDDPDNMLGRKEVARTQIDDTDIAPLELNPGEASIHHALLLHSSGINHSPHDRIGFAVRYIAADNPQKGEVRGTATLAAGHDHGTYEPEQAPEGLMHPAAMRRHAHILREGHKVIFGS